MPTTFHQLALCVSDLEVSRRFYCEGLGFVSVDRQELGTAFADVLEIEGEVDAVAEFVRRDDLTLELMWYRSPGSVGDVGGSRNHLGVTHLAFNCDDVDRLAEELEALGGRRIDQTRFATPGLDLVFVADPDGLRIELVSATVKS